MPILFAAFFLPASGFRWRLRWPLATGTDNANENMITNISKVLKNRLCLIVITPLLERYPKRVSQNFVDSVSSWGFSGAAVIDRETDGCLGVFKAGLTFASAAGPGRWRLALTFGCEVWDPA
jgi:hypothetical protein